MIVIVCVLILATASGFGIGWFSHDHATREAQQFAEDTFRKAIEQHRAAKMHLAQAMDRLAEAEADRREAIEMIRQFREEMGWEEKREKTDL